MTGPTIVTREWRVHQGPLTCSECGGMADVYYVRWARSRDVMVSDADEHLCQGCADETDLGEMDEDLLDRDLAAIVNPYQEDPYTEGEEDEW